MEYPNDYETQAFPAGASISITRVMGIAVSVVFFLIIFTCIFLIWATRSARVDPFIVSIDSDTGDWQIIENPNNIYAKLQPISQSNKVTGQVFQKKHTNYTPYRAMQESLIVKFAKNLFRIDNAPIAQNTVRWHACDRNTVCQSIDVPFHNDNECAIYCATNDAMFTKFLYNIVPQWTNFVQNGEYMQLLTKTIKLSPIGEITERGGNWHMHATIKTSTMGNIDIIAYIDVSRDEKTHPDTLGFYINDFNAYKIK